jgi:AraC family transcriptional regulator of adaptative response/methylated-DNA-[protein]-cysteine methyltransferase
MNDYQTIEKAIGFICDHFPEQPQLEKIAQEVHLSPFHFQRLFKKWAGVSPKKFLQFMSLTHAKKLLRQNGSILDVSLETGLSGPRRLHDLFMNIEAMTPGEYKQECVGLTIRYQTAETPFGKMVVASMEKGICHLEFINQESQALPQIKRHFSRAKILQKKDEWQMRALSVFGKPGEDLKQIQLHIKGTPFQLKVWQALLQIPLGSLASYGQIAQNIHNRNACRAVGTAVGENPIAYLIPCHRVIQSTGIFGNYGGGKIKKVAMIGWEAARVFGEN